MSIEKALADLAEAVRENTDLLKKMTGAAAARVKTVDSEKSSEPAGKPVAKAAAKPAAKAAVKPAKVTLDALKKAANLYIDVEDEDEYQERRDVIKAIAGHFEVSKLTEADPADYPKIMMLLELAKAGDLDIDDIDAALGDGGEDAEEEDEDSKPVRRGRGRPRADV